MASVIMKLHEEMISIRDNLPRISYDILYNTHPLFGTHMIERALLETNRSVVNRKSINNLVLDLQDIQWTTHEICVLLSQIYNIAEHQNPKPNLKLMNQIDDILDALDSKTNISRDDSEDGILVEDALKNLQMEDDSWSDVDEQDKDDGFKTPEDQIIRNTDLPSIPPPLPLRRENTHDYILPDDDDANTRAKYDLDLMREYPLITSIEYEDSEVIEGWGGNSQTPTPKPLDQHDFEEIYDWYSSTYQPSCPASETDFYNFTLPTLD